MNGERASRGGPSDGRDPAELLLEAATTAHREREAATGRIRPSPAWMDLSPDGRQRLFAHQLASRILERAGDPEGLSTTARCVLARARNLEQLDDS